RRCTRPQHRHPHPDARQWHGVGACRRWHHRAVGPRRRTSGNNRQGTGTPRCAAGRVVILLLDHEDSFVHTLAGYLTCLGATTRVVRDDTITLAEVQALQPAGIVLSPGPCTPLDCPLALDVVRTLGPTTPILGV